MMNHAMFKSIVYCGLTFFACSSHAEDFLSSLINSINSVGAGIWRGQECKDNYIYTASDQTKAHLAQGKSLLSKNPCQAANYFGGVVQSSQGPLKEEAQFYLIHAYTHAGDTIGALNAANDYLKAFDSTARSADVRWIIIEIIGKNIENNKDIEPYWAKMALGLHEDQTRSNPLFQNFVILNYLRRFPNSPYRQQALDWHEKAYRIVADHFLTIGRYYYDRGEYKAAIVRLQPLWAQGPQLEIFPEVLYLSVRAYVDFAKQIADLRDGRTGNFLIQIFKGKALTEPELKSLLEIPYSESIDYNREISSLMEQAQTIYEMMLDGLPQNPWTRKAGDYIR